MEEHERSYQPQAPRCDLLLSQAHPARSSPALRGQERACRLAGDKEPTRGARAGQRAVATLGGRVHGATARHRGVAAVHRVDRRAAFRLSPTTHYHNVLQTDEWNRERGLTEKQYDDLDIGLDARESEMAEGLAMGDMSEVDHPIGSSLRLHGIALQKDSLSYRAVGYALLKAAVRAQCSSDRAYTGWEVESAGTHPPG
jgi:hypothetical protein